MKKYMFILLMCFVLSCNSEENSHFVITLKNQSTNNVLLCIRATNIEGKCTLSSGGTLEKNSVFEFRPYNSSIERQLGDNSKSILEIYFVNPKQYNEHGIFYDCDSIPLKNDILRHYQLTLEDLSQRNFTITYP